MTEKEVRQRVATLRSDWEAAKRDHTQANATQAGIELLVTFFEDIFKQEENQDQDTKAEAGAGAPAEQPQMEAPQISTGNASAGTTTDPSAEAPAGNAAATS